MKWFQRLKYKIKHKLFELQFRFSLHKERLILVDDRYDRAIGKTTLLKKYSKKLNIPVVVGNTPMYYFYKRDGINVIYAGKENDIRGLRPKQKYLLEEHVPIECIKYLKYRGMIKGGFINI